MNCFARWLGVSAVFVVSACAAQSPAATPAPPPVVAAPAAPAPPPLSRNIDENPVGAEERADILKILSMTLEPQMEAGMVLGFKQAVERGKSGAADDMAHREMADAMLEMMREVIQEEFATGDSEFLRGTVRVYAANFTPAEIKQLLEFYQTAFGRKVIETDSETHKALLLGEKAFVSELLRKITAKMKEKTGKT